LHPTLTPTFVSGIERLTFKLLHELIGVVEIATDLFTTTRLTKLAGEYDAKAKQIEETDIFPKR
jgi:hypothetical protein